MKSYIEKITDMYDALYEKKAVSPTYARIMTEVYGSDCLDIDPNSFSTLSDLQRIIKLLDILPGLTILDIPCGTGGPGQWLAIHTNTNIIGIDASPAGIRLAQRQAEKLLITDRCRYQVGLLEKTNLPDECCDAILNIDGSGLWFNEQQTDEMARLLKPDAPLIYLSIGMIDKKQNNSVRKSPFPDDSKFIVDHYEILEDWSANVKLLFDKTIQFRKELIAEMGKAAIPYLVEAINQPNMSDTKYYRRILVRARKI